MEYFARIEEPKKLRISLMTAAKDSILSVSSLEKVENIRQKKADVMTELKNDLNDISVFCKALSDLVADEKARKEILESLKSLQHEEEVEEKKAMKARAAAAKQSANEEEIAKPVLREKKTDADRLEYTLSQIEQKLADLNK